eukprot:Rmarinus@m.28880
MVVTQAQSRSLRVKNPGRATWRLLVIPRRKRRRRRRRKKGRRRKKRRRRESCGKELLTWTRKTMTTHPSPAKKRTLWVGLRKAKSIRRRNMSRGGKERKIAKRKEEDVGEPKTAPRMMTWPESAAAAATRVHLQLLALVVRRVTEGGAGDDGTDLLRGCSGRRLVIGVKTVLWLVLLLASDAARTRMAVITAGPERGKAVGELARWTPCLVRAVRIRGPPIGLIGGERGEEAASAGPSRIPRILRLRTHQARHRTPTPPTRTLAPMARQAREGCLRRGPSLGPAACSALWLPPEDPCDQQATEEVRLESRQLGAASRETVTCEPSEGKKGRKRVVLTADQAKGLTKKERFKLEMELSGSVGRGARRGSDGEIDVLEDEGGGRRGKKPQARSLQRRHSFSRMDDAAKEGEEFLFNALQEDTPPPGSVMCPNCGQTFRPTANHSGGIDLNSSMKQKLLGIPPNVLSRLTLGVPSTGQPSVSGTTGRSGTSGASGTSKAAAPRKPKDRMPFAWKKFLKNAKGQPPMSQKQFFDMTSGLFKARLEVSLQLDKEKDDAKLAMVENMQEYVCMYLQMKYGLKNIAEMQLAKMAVYLMAAKDRDEPRAIILARFCGMYSDESFLGQDAVDLFVRLLDAVSKQIGHRFWVMFADAFKRPIFVSREWLIDYCLHSFPPQSSAKNLGKKLAKALETTLAEAINLEAFLLQAMTLLVEAQANVTRFLQDAFRSLDDGDGVLDKDEFVSLIQHVAPSYNIMEAGKLFTECKKIENAITEHAFIVFVFNKRLGISLPDEYIVEDDIDDEGDIHLDLPPSPSLTPVPEGITAENGGETNAPGVSQTSPSGNEVPIGSMQALSGSFSLGTGGFALRQSEAEHNNPPDNSGDEVTGSADGADDLSASCQGTAREGAPSNADTVGNLEPSHDDTRPGSRDGTQHSLGSPLSPGHRGLPRTSSVGSVGNLSLSNGVEAEGSNEERSLSRQAPLPLSQLGQDGQQFPEPGGATSSDSSSGGG